jgi:hypothetical protein
VAKSNENKESSSSFEAHSSAHLEGTRRNDQVEITADKLIVV